MITKHEFNYGMVYLPNGCMMKEGYLEKWEYSGELCSIGVCRRFYG